MPPASLVFFSRMATTRFSAGACKLCGARQVFWRGSVLEGFWEIWDLVRPEGVPKCAPRVKGARRECIPGEHALTAPSGSRMGPSV